MKKSSGLLVVLLGLIFAAPSEAGCWLVTQGIHSYWKCDSAGIVPTFQHFREQLDQMRGISQECKDAALGVVGSSYACGEAIVAAIASHGAVPVMVGAGYACQAFTQEVSRADRACTSEYVNLRSSGGEALGTAAETPTMMRVCNYTEFANLYVAAVEYSGDSVARGWYAIAQGQCGNIFSVKQQGHLYAVGHKPEYSREFLPNENTRAVYSFCVSRGNVFNVPLRFEERCGDLGPAFSGARFGLAVSDKRDREAKVATWVLSDATNQMQLSF